MACYPVMQNGHTLLSLQPERGRQDRLNIFSSDLVESVDVELADVEGHLTGGRHSWRNFEEPQKAETRQSHLQALCFQPPC